MEVDTPYLPPRLQLRSDRPVGLGYDPLLDPNLNGFLGSRRMYLHLRKQGLVTKQGEIVDKHRHEGWVRRRDRGERLRKEVVSEVVGEVIDQRRRLEASYAAEQVAEEQVRRIDEIKLRRQQSKYQTASYQKARLLQGMGVESVGPTTRKRATATRKQQSAKLERARGHSERPASAPISSRGAAATHTRGAAG